MKDAINTYKRKDGGFVSIVPDNNPYSPREWDNMGTMLYRQTRSRYILGDKEETDEEIQRMIEEEDITYLPLYVYIHGGVTMNTTGFTCPWDSSSAGIIYMDRSDLKKEGITEEQAIECMKSEVETFDKYLCGDVYGVILWHEETCETCGNTEQITDDSYFGLYGYKDVLATVKEEFGALEEID